MKHLKKFEEKSFYEEDEGIVEGYLFTLFSDYLTFPNSNTKEYPFDTKGYSTVISRDDDPGDNYDYENGEHKYKYYTVKLHEIEIFEIKLDYTEGWLEIGEIYHRNHYMDLIKMNWKILIDYQYERMKNDILHK